VLKAALDYEERGLSIIPINVRDKKPLIKWKDYQQKRATRDDIRAWWRQWPNANIGIVTGAISGLIVLDCDSDEAMALARQRGLPELAPRVKTGKGWHIYFAHPGGRVRNFVKQDGDPIDLRGDGGYIVAPPSVHPTGKNYRWELEADELPPVPDWLAKIIVERDAKTGHDSNNEAVAQPFTGTTPYSRKALENEINALRDAPEGMRNDQLNRSAYRLFQFLAGGELPEDETYSTLYNAALETGLARDEITATLNSALQAAKMNPRNTPFTPSGGLLPTNPNPRREFVQACLRQEERGDALLLAHMFNGRLAFDADSKEWYLWAGHHWNPDRTGKMSALVERVARQYLRVADEVHEEMKVVALEGGEDGKAAVEEHNKKSALHRKLITRGGQLRKHQRIQNVLKIASTLQDVDSLSNIPVTGDVWDRDPWLLGVKNGVIDLRTGEFRSGRPEDRIRTVAPTEWRGIDAPAPRWEKFISEIFINPELPPFMQRLLGYAITGDTSEHVLPILWGDQGRNGKDTLLATLKAVLGAIAGAVSNDVLIDNSKNRPAGAAQPHLVDLQGKRLVWASETREGDRLNAAQVKLITGGGAINARQLYGKMYSFEPTHKLFLLTNNKPHAPAEDDALWGRVLLIPFELRFVDNPTAPNERQRDTHLKDRLTAEAPGILAWLVRGCLQWQRKGLNPPECVKAATEEYRSEEDTIRAFLDECCIMGERYEVKAGDLYQAYRLWSVDNGIHPMSGTAFGKRIKKLSGDKRHKRGGAYYGGIGLLDSAPRAKPPLM
jgi:putative DNA primase/helicase